MQCLSVLLGKLAGYLSVSLPLLESSKPSKNSTPVLSKQSARWQVSKELYQTESNYVDILSTILQVGLGVLLCIVHITSAHSQYGQF